MPEIEEQEQNQVPLEPVVQKKEGVPRYDKADDALRIADSIDSRVNAAKENYAAAWATQFGVGDLNEAVKSYNSAHERVEELETKLQEAQNKLEQIEQERQAREHQEKVTGVIQSSEIREEFHADVPAIASGLGIDLLEDGALEKLQEERPYLFEEVVVEKTKGSQSNAFLNPRGQNVNKEKVKERIKERVRF